MQVWSIPGVSRDHLRVTSDSLLSEIPLSEKKERINHNQLRMRLNISLTAGIEHVT